MSGCCLGGERINCENTVVYLANRINEEFHFSVQQCNGSTWTAMFPLRYKTAAGDRCLGKADLYEDSSHEPPVIGSLDIEVCTLVQLAHDKNMTHEFCMDKYKFQRLSETKTKMTFEHLNANSMMQSTADDLLPSTSIAIEPRPRRRSSLLDTFKSGCLLASARDIDGARFMDPTNFSTLAAKLDETFGTSALTETGFTEVGMDEATKLSRLALSEDALRQMS